MSKHTHLRTASRSLARWSLVAAALALSPTLTQAGGGKAPPEAGVWIDDTGRGAVKIDVCGSKLCGRIVWLRELNDKSGRPLIDRHNPNADMNSRPICGLPVLGNLQAMPEGGFDAGWVYDPKVGKTYNAAITLDGPNVLQVTGYLGVRFLGKTLIWTRAKDALPACDATAAAAPPKSGSTKKATAGGETLPWAKGN